MTMTLVASSVVGAGGAASIEFTGIPQTGTDLLVVLSGRDTTTNGAAIIQFNNDATATNYTRRYLFGDGASAGTSSANSFAYALIPRSDTTASTFGNSSFYVPNYQGAANKSFSIDSVSENNASTAYQEIWAAIWANTSAITAVKLTKSAGTFAQYSSASLYLVTKGSGGASVS